MMGANNKETKKTPRIIACAGLAGVTGVILIVAGLLVIFLFRGFVDKMIKSEIPLRMGGQVTDAWLHPPVKPLLKFFFFNTTNPEDFLRGKKPILREVGPYVYEEDWEKVGVEWGEKGQRVKYQLRKFYRFRSDLSNGLREGDRLTLPNIPMFASINQMKFAGRLVQQALSSMLEILRQEVFNSTSVSDIIWGFDHPLIKLGNDVLPKEKRLPFDKFGFFVNKNGSTDGVWESMTGMDDVHNVGKVISFDGRNTLGVWGSTDCDRIKGTDGSIFPPDLLPNQTLHVFNKDLCQSLPLEYQKTVTHHGIDTYRFVPPSNVWAPPSENPYNRCYCPRSNCPSRGLFNVSACQFGGPIFLSWPHFFQGDPTLLQKVEGLHPDAEKHQFHMDILPKMGVAMRAAVRSQINLVMRASKMVKQVSGVRDMVYPVMWLQDGVDEINDEETISLLQTAVHTTETARTVLYPVLLVVGSLTIIITIVFLTKRFIMSKLTSGHPPTDLDNRFSTGHINPAGPPHNGVPVLPHLPPHYTPEYLKTTY